MFFAEVDVPSYKMRYGRTWTIFKNKKNQKLFQAYVQEMEDDSWYLRVYSKIEGTFKDARQSIENIAPAYYPIQAGYYPVMDNDTRSLSVSRKLVKSFLVGYHPNTFLALDPVSSRIATPDLVPDLLNPITTVNVEKALKSHGPISRRLFITKSRIYYLHKVVGMRNKRNFVVDPLFKSEIEDCLRGHECTVTL